MVPTARRGPRGAGARPLLRRLDPDALVDGRTLLHDAAWEGELDRVEALLAAGADPGIRDLTYGTTPLGWAEHAFQTEVAERLRPLTTD